MLHVWRSSRDWSQLYSIAVMPRFLMVACLVLLIGLLVRRFRFNYGSFGRVLSVSVSGVYRWL